MPGGGAEPDRGGDVVARRRPHVWTKHMIARRKLLALGTALGTVGLIGGGAGAFVFSDRYRGWIRSTLQRALPGYSLEPEGFARFVDDYNAKKPDSTKLRV